MKLNALRIAAASLAAGVAISVAPVQGAMASTGGGGGGGSCPYWYSTADRGATIVNCTSHGVTAHEYCSNGYFQGDQYVAAGKTYHSTRTWWCTGSLTVRSFS